MFVAGLEPVPDCWEKIWPNAKLVEKISAKSHSDLVRTFMDGRTIIDSNAKSNLDVLTF
jgi:hypothetical protein